MLDNSILDLVDYGVRCNLLRTEDEIYVINSILTVYSKADFAPDREAQQRSLEEILSELLSEAENRGIIDEVGS